VATTAAISTNSPECLPTPAERGALAVNLSASSKLSSPVYDGNTGNVIVALWGVLHSVTASGGIVFGTTVSVGDVIADAPLVDSGAENSTPLSHRVTPTVATTRV